MQSLLQRGLSFVMRCDNNSDWPAVHEFIRSGRSEALVVLNTPSARDAADWGCQLQAPQVRLVRQVAPSGAVRVLATNLTPAQAPAADFGALYHRRWRIEEAFKRLKHRLHLGAVSGLTQQALVVDVAAKVLADNIAALMCATAQATRLADTPQRLCNRSYACGLMQRVPPHIVLMIGDTFALIANAVYLLAANTQRRLPGRSRPRTAHPVKPHPRYAYKG